MKKTKEPIDPCKPIFSRHQYIDKMAFMSWRMDGSDVRSLINIGDGFLNSAILLAKCCIRNNKRKQADILIFPIFANANHGIEVYLKAIAWILNQLLKSEKKVEGSHNIDQIYKMVRAKVIEFSGKEGVKDFDAATHNLKDYIHELYKKINATSKEDKMDFSRYPFNNKYEDHFYVESLHSEVDLPNFVKRFKKIAKNLDMYADYLFYVHLQGEPIEDYELSIS